MHSQASPAASLGAAAGVAPSRRLRDEMMQLDASTLVDKPTAAGSAPSVSSSILSGCGSELIPNPLYPSPSPSWSGGGSDSTPFPSPSPSPGEFANGLRTSASGLSLSSASSYSSLSTRHRLAFQTPFLSPMTPASAFASPDEPSSASASASASVTPGSSTSAASAPSSTTAAMSLPALMMPLPMPLTMSSLALLPTSSAMEAASSGGCPDVPPTIKEGSPSDEQSSSSGSASSSPAIIMNSGSVSTPPTAPPSTNVSPVTAPIGIDAVTSPTTSAEAKVLQELQQVAALSAGNGSCDVGLVAISMFKPIAEPGTEVAAAAATDEAATDAAATIDEDALPPSLTGFRIQLPSGSCTVFPVVGAIGSGAASSNPVSSPVGSPLAADLSEEQLQHIQSLVRKTKKPHKSRHGRHSRHRHGHHGGANAPPNSIAATPSAAAAANGDQVPTLKLLHCPPSARGSGAGAGLPTPLSTSSMHSNSSGSSSGLLSASSALSSVRSLAVPTSSPGSGIGAGSLLPLSSSLRSPRQSPSLAFSSSPRNVNIYKLRLPSSTQSSPSTNAGGSGRAAAASPPSGHMAIGGLQGSPLGSDGSESYTDEDDEDDEDFTSVLATPGNAGLGAEEDGEIILCGLHVPSGAGHNGAGSAHRRQNSSGTLAPSSGGESSEGENSEANTPTAASAAAMAAGHLANPAHQQPGEMPGYAAGEAAVGAAATIHSAEVTTSLLQHYPKPSGSLRPLTVPRTLTFPMVAVPSAALSGQQPLEAAVAPSFSSASFDTTLIDQRRAQAAHSNTQVLPVLHASAAQQEAESNANTPPQMVTPQLRAAPPGAGADPPANELGGTPLRLTTRKVSRRATLSGAECGLALGHMASGTAAAGGKHSGKSRSSVPYDFSPAGHLIIDGFEISKRGVARTPEVQSRRLSLGGPTSCGNSPMLSGHSILASLHHASSPASATAAAAPPSTMPALSLTSAVDIVPSPAGSSASHFASASGLSTPVLPRRLAPLGAACPPTPVFSAAPTSEPPSLTSTPTLLCRRLSLVKLQREKSKVEEAAQAAQALLSASPSRLNTMRSLHHRRCDSAGVSLYNSLPALVTPSGFTSEPVSAAVSLDPLVPSEAELRASFGPGFRPPKAASLGIELRLSDLVRLGEIGRGVNGAVYKAVYLPTLRIVALKSVSIFDKDERHQFLQELNAFLHCSSEHMVKFVGACFSEGMITMALEYLNRGSLDHVVTHSGPLPEKVLRLVVQQLLMGVRDLHAQGFLHRDIKPGNFLCSNSGVSVISDFGLLKRLETDALTGGVKECSKFVGTLLYLAPERISGQAFSFPSDIYAVGLSVIFLATGALEEVPRDYWALVAASHSNNTAPPSLPADGPFSPALRDFVSKMMVKEPTARWTAEQLLQHPWFAEGEAAAAADAAAGIDPLEHWPGRQPTEPNADELSNLVDAVVHRWYPMPTADSIHAAGGVPPPLFVPSSFDHARFTHLAQQLGWEEKAVVDAFTKRIREKTAATLTNLGIVAHTAEATGNRSGQLQDSTAAAAVDSAEVMSFDSSSSSSAASSAPSSALCSALSSASGSFSIQHTASNSPLLAPEESSSSVSAQAPSTAVPIHAHSSSMPLALPLHHGSPRGVSTRGCSGSGPLSTRSLTSSPLLGSAAAGSVGGVCASQCLSPTTANKPPKAPPRSHSPGPAERMAELTLPPVTNVANSGGAGATAPAAASATAAAAVDSSLPAVPSRLASRRLSASGRRLSFQLRRGDMLIQGSAGAASGGGGGGGGAAALGASTASSSAPSSQPMSGANSPRGSAPRSLGLPGAAEALAAAIAALPRARHAATGSADVSPRPLPNMGAGAEVTTSAVPTLHATFTTAPAAAQVLEDNH